MHQLQNIDSSLWLKITFCFYKLKPTWVKLGQVINLFEYVSGSWDLLNLFKLLTKIVNITKIGPGNHVYIRNPAHQKSSTLRFSNNKNDLSTSKFYSQKFSSNPYVTKTKTRHGFSVQSILSPQLAFPLKCIEFCSVTNKLFCKGFVQVSFYLQKQFILSKGFPTCSFCQRTIAYILTTLLIQGVLGSEAFTRRSHTIEHKGLTYRAFYRTVCYRKLMK